MKLLFFTIKQKKKLIKFTKIPIFVKRCQIKYRRISYEKKKFQSAFHCSTCK